jgi:uncharacterized protein (UPF0332 family)
MIEVADHANLVKLVDRRLRLAEEMLQASEIELRSARLVETRVSIYLAIDQLDKALGLIWEYEQHDGSGAGDGHRVAEPEHGAD